ncbi:trehalose-phosphatase [Aurantimonas sp. A2-1-M11]|uniref:trehalose-phosphatase n=1 Tax=Aurantimonas sp. A2-1-M11 TaxID=3113712 RepID=UPI002F92FDE5
MDGVVTNTADAHFAAWKEVFDDLLRNVADGPSGFRPFTREDYIAHVDGVPRHEGIRRFLASRAIDLPVGDADDPSDATSRGLGKLKNDRFQYWLDRNAVPAFDDARALVAALRHCGMSIGVFSASRNARRVLDSAGVRNLFDTVVDGVDAGELGLSGKPDPAMLVETARRLDCAPDEVAVVEDALSGVEAGARGRFSLVVGINRQIAGARTQGHALRTYGADLVVRDLRQLLTDDGAGLRTLDRIPTVWDRQQDLEARIGGRRLAVFLDYDGTLTPIVEDFSKADICGEMVEAIGQLAARVPTAIVSGRDLSDVRGRVGLEQVFYAGSHGFDIAGPGDLHERPEQAGQFLSPIEAAGNDLEDAIRGIGGAQIERKTFSIAVHVRKVAETDFETVERAVDAVVGRQPKLRKSRGKKVFEIQPRAEWDKGNAVEWLLDNTRLGEGDALALYIGDDLTDEDAFAALSGRGIAIVVRGADRITTADYALDDAQDVRRFLGWLAARIAEPEE